MGREIRCRCQWGADSGEVTALLETSEIIVRGDLHHRVALPALTDLRATDAGLGFTVGHEAVTLGMTPKEAAVWAARIATPPPGLAQKLGVGPAALALLWGSPPPALAEALHNTTTKLPDAARMMIAVVGTETDLAAALAAHATLPAEAPIWVVHGKGSGAAFGEARVRAFMRDRGYIDSKVSAICDTHTATRYAPRRG